MARQIDERVVEMRFDNSDFMNKVKPTISKLDELKKSLQLEGAAKGFDAMQQAANKVDMKGLGSAVDGVKERFSALEAVALGALMRIGQRAIDAGTQLLNSLTIAPISQGFEEYELKMNSVQTIMASTGESLDTVNQYLEELNHYADKTIYSFSDMTQNIGKFTNSGVELLDAVKAIQGVSNEAALAGANANEASRAMYNFAQALSAGYVKLIDWKSIENANMATVGFKEQLIETAEVLGTVVKEGDDYRSVTTDLNGKTSDLFNATKNYNDSLAHQWLTTEVLVQTLSNYSTDIREMTAEEKKAYEEKLKTIGYTEEQIQKIEELGQKAFDAAQTIKTYHQLLDTLREAVGSGWAQTFEMIFGDFEEAKTLWTSVNEVVGGFLDKQAQARNDMIKSWKHLGGRDNLFQGLADTGKTLLSIFTPIKEAFQEIFPPMQVQTLLKITNGFKQLASTLSISDATAEKIKTGFKGVFEVFKGGAQGIGALLHLLTPFGAILKDIGGFGLDVFSQIGTSLSSFVESIRSSSTISDVYNSIYDSIVKFVDGFRQFVTAIKESQTVSSIFNTMKSLMEGIKNAISGLVEDLKNGTASITSFFTSLTSGFANLKIGGDSKDGISQEVDEQKKSLLSFTGIMEQFKSMIAKYQPALDEIFSKIENSFHNFGSTLQKIISNIGNSGIFGLILKIFTAGSIMTFEANIATLGGKLGGVFKSVSKTITETGKSFNMIARSINGVVQQFKTSLKGLTDIFKEVKNVFKAYQQELQAKALKEIAGAIAILVASLYVLSKIDAVKLLEATAAIMLLLGELTVILQKISKIEIDKKTLGSFTVLSTMLKTLAKSVLLLAIALKVISTVETDKLIQSLAAVSLLLTEMVIVMKGLTKIPDNKKASVKISGLISMAISILILAEAVKSFASLDIGSLVKGLAAVSVVMMELGILMAASEHSKLKTSTGLAFVGIAASLLILQSAVDKFGNMDNDALKAGMAAVSILLSEMALLGMALNKIKIHSLIPQLILFAATASLLHVLSGVLQEIGGMPLENIGNGLVALGGGLAELAVAALLMDKAGSGAMNLFVLISSLSALSTLFEKLGEMSWGSIVKALVGLGGALLIIGGVTALISPIIPAMLGLSAALIGFSGAALIVSAAAFVLAAAIGVLAISFSMLATSGVAGAAALIETIKIIIEGVADIIITLASKLVEIVGSLIKIVCEAILNNLSTIAETILQLLIGLNTYVPRMVQILSTLVTNIMDTLAQNIPAIVTSAVGLIKAIFGAIIDEIMKVDPSELSSRILGLEFLAGFFITLALLASLAPAAMVGVVELGVLVTELAGVLAALGGLMKIPGLSNFIDKGAELFEKIGGAIGGFIGNFVGELLGGITSKLPQIALDLSMFMMNLQPFILGTKMIDSDMLESIKFLAEAILLITATDLIDSLTSWITGGASLSEFGKSLSEFTPYFRDFANQTSGINGQNVKNCAEAMKVLFQAFSEIPNEGGIISWLTGDNVLTEDYAKQVVNMGTSLKGFYDETKFVSRTKVEDAAGALTSLFKAFSEIPNEGGVIGWFTGDNVISEEYGNKMVAMGTALSSFSDEIGSVKKDKILESADALTALFAAFGAMPNEGGVIGWFTGSNEISEEYGDQIVAMGRALAGYSSHAMAVNKDKVIESADALKSLFQAFSEMPNEGGIISWFTGDNDLATFGASLSSFGTALYDFTHAEIDYEKLAIAIVHITKLADLAQRLADMGGAMYSLSDFISSISFIADGALDSFIETFSEEGIEDAIEAIEIFLQTIIDTFLEWQEMFYQNAITIIQAWINGIIAMYPVATLTATTFINQFILILTISLPLFLLKGIQSANEFLNGIKSKYWEAFATGQKLALQALSGVRVIIPAFFEAGAQAGQGLADGLWSKVSEVEAAAAALAAAAATASAVSLKINSPSKVFIAQGHSVGEGMVIGITDCLTTVAKAATALGDKAIETSGESMSAIRTVLTDGISTDLVISPKFDLSGVKTSAEEINRMFNDSVQAIALTADSVNSSVHASKTNAIDSIQNQPVSSEGTTGNTYNFIQNNTSPKALSRIEIYRQTKRQFSSFRREVGR